MKNKLLYFLVSLLGFATACDKEKEPVEMYGVPRADLRVRGKVTDTAGTPIKGIQVSCTPSEDKKTLTAADGTYDFSGEQTGTTLHLTFADIDGPENGGEFDEKLQDVVFTEADRTGKKDGWYTGSFEKKNIDIQLTDKE